MKYGEFPNGAKTLRAKIDMASPQHEHARPGHVPIIHMRHHHRGKMCIYTMYASPPADAIEGVSHSLCSIEYEVTGPVDWVVEQCNLRASQAIEFASSTTTRS
jgi:glutaminyl-tRNA synthetase